MWSCLTFILGIWVAMFLIAVLSSDEDEYYDE